MSSRGWKTRHYVEAIIVVIGFAVVAVLGYRAWSIGQDPWAGFRPADELRLHGLQVFPPSDPWNTDISADAVDENSSALIATIGTDGTLHPDFGTTYRGAPMGIPFTIVAGDQPRVPVSFRHEKESDAGPYPIPPDAPVEGGRGSNGDRHLLVLDKSNLMLYELYRAIPEDDGKRWRADSGAIFDLRKNSMQRPPGWTSADAGGLPIFAGLARYEEVVEQGKLTHALRFTVRRTRRAFVPPATRYASYYTETNLPPMGMRVRLKRDFDISSFPPTAQVILQGLKTYGMILADNGGDWFISGAPDPRWSVDELDSLTRVKGSDLEVVRMGEIQTTFNVLPRP